VIPLWDPNVQSGRSFVAEMESGLFYPLKALLYFWPFDDSGLLSKQLLNHFYLLSHLLAACFMFLLGRDLGLAAFPAVVAAVCFALGGFFVQVGWVRWLDGAVWLPLIVLFTRRAIVAASSRAAVWNSFLAGSMLGLVILAGCLHLALMDTLVVASLT